MRVVDLFAGAGGFSLGFKWSGFNPIWAIDFDRSACETYSNNIGKHIICADITKIDLTSIPSCDIIIGGSPCQGFSNSNRVSNFLDNPKNLLVKKYIEAVKVLKPKVFVLENVPQIITSGDGKFLREICESLSEYEIDVKVLNSADFGVAQTRKRAIFIGSRVGKILNPYPTTEKYVTVREIFDGLTEEILNQKDYSKAKPESVECMRHIPQGGNFNHIPINIRPKGNHSSKYKRLSLDHPSITITNPRKTMLLHPTENRILSIRECARIQSFPDDFKFFGNLADKQQQVANAVPPLMGKAIADQIRRVLNEQINP